MFQISVVVAVFWSGWFMSPQADRFIRASFLVVCSLSLSLSLLSSPHLHMLYISSYIQWLLLHLPRQSVVDGAMATSLVCSGTLASACQSPKASGGDSLLLCSLVLLKP